jgi:hypothetical protein
MPAHRRGLAGRLKGGTAAIALLAITVAAPLGVLLPQPAVAAGGAIDFDGADTMNDTYTVSPGDTFTSNITLPMFYGSAGTPWTLSNAGTIHGFSFGTTPAAPEDDWAVQIEGGNAAVVNSTSGLIQGYVGVYLGGGTITNDGTIQGAGGTLAGGIKINGSGTVSNSGAISGTGYGVYLGNGGTVENLGTVIGISGSGISLANGGTVTNSGTIKGGNGHSDAAISASGSSAFVSNSGVITSSSQLGIDLRNGGTVVNAAGGSVYGNFIGVRVTGAGGIVTNSGTITSGTAVSVDLLDGGTVENLGTASLIAGHGSGVLIGVSSGAGTVTNQGIIKGGSGFGVYLGSGGGQVTNSGTASQITAAGGVLAAGQSTISNDGTIIGTGNVYSGVHLDAGGRVTNSGTASYIGGGPNAIALYGTISGTVVNQGTIVGASKAGILVPSSPTAASSPRRSMASR